MFEVSRLGTQFKHTYTPHQTNRKPKATYALKAIHELVNTCPILHVSFNLPDSPFPMMLPMIGQMGSFARPSSDLGDVLELYLHGYVSSRLINLSRKAVAAVAAAMEATHHQNPAVSR